MAAKLRDKVKIDILKNKLGTVIGVNLNGEKIPYIKSVNFKANSKDIPIITLELFCQNVNIVEVDTTGTHIPKDDENK